MIVIARSYGQLGNRLFLYGHFLAAAAEYGVELANPCFAEYAHLFPATAGDLWCRYPVATVAGPPPSVRARKWLSRGVYTAARGLSILGGGLSPVCVLRIKGEQSYDLGSHDFASAVWSQHVLAQGWLFRSERLFVKHADKVRDHFRISNTRQAVVRSLIDRIRDHADAVVGVHIRQGDYATFLSGKYFYTVSQYVERMRQIADQLSPRRVAFLVCSNARLQPQDFDGLQVHFGSGQIVEDLYALASADLLIGPPSTFTGWASFYGKVPLFMMESADEPIDVRSLMATTAARAA
jgi:hypothetical protein